MTRTVILGASSGLGAALVARLATEGQSVWAGARRIGALRHQTAGWPTVQARYCDVTNPASVARFWEQVGWAGDGVTGLVVTVGAQGEINPVAASDPDAWAATVTQNLVGPYLAVRDGLAHLAPGARIVLCAGGGSHAPWPRYSAYACAKAGVVRLVETLAAELADDGRGISVNALAPGFLPTPIHQATLAAGPTRAGVEYLRTRQWLDAATDALAQAVACAAWLLTVAPAALTGRTISAQHDPWATDPAALLTPGAGTTARVRPAVGVPV